MTDKEIKEVIRAYYPELRTKTAIMEMCNINHYKFSRLLQEIYYENEIASSDKADDLYKIMMKEATDSGQATIAQMKMYLKNLKNYLNEKMNDNTRTKIKQEIKWVDIWIREKENNLNLNR